MKARLISAWMLAASSLPSTAYSPTGQPVDFSDDRLDRLEREVRRLRAEVSDLKEQLALFRRINPSVQPSRAEVSSSSRSHTVRAGDTLWQIARQHGISLSDLQSANPDINARQLRVGLELRLPGTQNVSSPPRGERAEAPKPAPTGAEYRIKSGDTLSHIALAHGVSLADLKAANPSLNPRKLFVGKIVNIPGDTAPHHQTSEIAPSPPALPPIEDSISSFEHTSKLITVNKASRFSYLAEAYGTDVATLNRLNEVELSGHQMIQAGSEILVPTR